jgi:hypothetical protein
LAAPGVLVGKTGLDQGVRVGGGNGFRAVRGLKKTSVM